MNKGKWILLGFLLLIPLLLRKLLANLGWQISSEASTWLLLTIVAFFVVSIAVPKEHQKWAKWFTVLFLLLFLSSTCFNRSRKNQNQGQSVTISTSPTVITQSPKTSKIKQTSWGYVVEFTGWEFEGVRVFIAEKDVEVTVRWIPGGKIDNPEGEDITNPWGYDDYISGYRSRFGFSWIPGVRPHAVLALIKKSGDTLDSVREEDVFSFNKQKQEKEIRLRMNPGEELVLYYHDINDPEYFQRNGKNGSYIRFEVEIF